MNRRDMLKVIPAAALVAPTLAAGAAPTARLVWIALCRGVDQSGDYMPTGDEYAAKQVAKGRRVAMVLERAADSTLVVVEQEFASFDEARAALHGFNEWCIGDDSDGFTAEYGHVWAFSLVGSGQVLDVLRFLELKDQDRVRRLELQVQRIQRDLLKA